MTQMIPKPTPVALDNRPGLEQLTRRTGRHALFKESMMRGLRSRHRPGLTGFATQSDADWSIALIDAWASVCDVLSFYGERISHESYLRTATELFSVEALAELIGYQLTPPTAAETHLAFMAEDDEDAHLLTLLPPGIGIKSIPGEGEQPQSFETVEDLRIKAAWNAMPVLGHWPQSLGPSDRGMFVDAQRTQLRPGARVVMLDGQGAPVADPVNGKLLRRVAEVRSVNAQVSFAALARDVATPALPDPASLLRPLPALGSVLPTTSPAEMIAGLKTNRWDRALVLEASDELNLDLADLGRSLRAQPHVEEGLQPQVLTLACRFFGHNALTQRAETVLDPVPGKIWDQRGGIVDTSALPALGLGERELFLDRDYGDIAPGMLLVVRGFSGADMFEAWSHVLEAESVSLEAFGLSGEATRLVVPQDWNTVEGAEIDIGALYVRGSALFTLPAPVTLPDVPIAADVAGAEILLDKPDVDLAPGQFVFVTGERSDMPGVTASERVQIKEVEVNGTTGRLIVEPALSHPYQRASVTLNANTARATHGESLTQVLGSGDATKPFQSFTLKDSPLTYVSADTASGRAATLKVFVEGVKWHEVAAFDQAEPGARVYVLTTLSDGSSRVTFGNGVMGARLPTGLANIEARYRKGAGAQGRVRAGQLSLLASKPRSLSSVSNPLPATGGSDGEALEDARMNAPLPVLTLGRVVSLKDFTDFARGFAGVTKAHAAWSWVGRNQTVFLSVAGETPDPLPIDSGVIPNLKAAIEQAAPPGTGVVIRSARVVGAVVSAKLRIDPDYTAQSGGTGPVFDAARAALRTAFSFECRAVGAPLRASEVVSVLQGVDGVIGVDLDLLHRVANPPVRADILRAHLPRQGGQGALQGGELIVLSDEPIVLGVF